MYCMKIVPLPIEVIANVFQATYKSNLNPNGQKLKKLPRLFPKWINM
jgi:hypothetical protein